MTHFEEFKNMDIDTLARWVDKNGAFDGSPWIKWWEKKYCSKCEPIECSYEETKKRLGIEPFYKHSVKCSYCELEHRCRFFPELDYVPDNKDIIKMWLETEEN